MKVGDYVRTDDGLIRKIEKIERNAITTDISLNDYSSNLINRKYLEECIIKSSPNIIDLLEPNDFIKYKLIYNGYEKNQILYKCIKDGRDLLDLKYRINNKKISIKSILTKEQFENWEYKIGE